MRKDGDTAESEAKVSNNEDSVDSVTSDGVLMKGLDESGTADADIGADSTENVKDNEEEPSFYDNSKSMDDTNNVNLNESSPLSVCRVETSQPTPDFQTDMIETKGSDASHVVESKGSDISLTEVVPASPEMKHSISMNSDEKSYTDIQQIPSSSSDIIFDDAPSSPDSQPTPFVSAAASPSSIESIAKGILPIEATSDPCALSVDSGVDAAAASQTSPSSSKSEEKSVAAVSKIYTRLLSITIIFI